MSNLGQIDPPSFDDDGRRLPYDVAIGTVWGGGTGLLVFGAGDQLHVTMRCRVGQLHRLNRPVAAHVPASSSDR